MCPGAVAVLLLQRGWCFCCSCSLSCSYMPKAPKEGPGHLPSGSAGSVRRRASGREEVFFGVQGLKAFRRFFWRLGGGGRSGIFSQMLRGNCGGLCSLSPSLGRETSAAREAARFGICAALLHVTYSVQLLSPLPKPQNLNPKPKPKTLNPNP